MAKGVRRPGPLLTVTLQQPVRRIGAIKAPATMPGPCVGNAKRQGSILKPAMANQHACRILEMALGRFAVLVVIMVLLPRGSIG